MSRLTFDELLAKSATRRDRWHGPETVPWTGADWSNAMCGEAGEAANVVKKLRRHETGTAGDRDGAIADLIEALGYELADTIAYAALVAEHYCIDLSDAIAAKFNLISEREGFPDRLPRRTDENEGERWARWNCSPCRGTGIYQQNGIDCGTCKGTGYVWVQVQPFKFGEVQPGVSG